MALKTFSQIPTATTPPTGLDTLIGVRNGTTDIQFPSNLIGLSINTTPILSGTSGRFLYDAASTVGETTSMFYGSGLVNVGNNGPNVLTTLNLPSTFQISNFSSNYCFALHQYSNDAGGTASMSFFKSRGTSAGSNVALHSGDSIAFISFGGPDSVNNVQLSSFIQTLVDAAPTNGSVPGRIQFHTSASGSNANPERMRIDSGGNITVGGVANTTLDGASGAIQAVTYSGNPWGLTSINAGAVFNGGSLALAHTRGGLPSTQTALIANDQLGAVSFLGSDGTNYVPTSVIAAWVDGAVTTGNVPTRLVLQTGTATYGLERLRIDSVGNVIINTGAVATNATNGFLYIETCAGTPTGVPTGYTGRVPIVYDTSANKIWFYNGSWRGVVVT